MSDIQNIQIGGSRRNLQLDCLRGLAILMVMMCHTILFRVPEWDAPLVQCGWAGVDLFFVLSGFLISGLLFAEYRRRGEIRFRRFAVRRALKLYPAFYALVLLTVCVRLRTDNAGPVLRAFLHDVFFMQSYTPGTYGHFWSLSVEEHFYILLPLTLYFMLRRGLRAKGPGRGSDPFGALPWLFGVVAIATLLARLWTARHVPFTWQTHLFPTHLRMDSLLFGVVLSYWSQFHGEKFWGFVRPRRALFLLVGAFLMSPAFFFSQYDPWMYTYGFTVLYLAFGAFLLAALSTRVESWPRAVHGTARGLGYIGGFSYSIYLWHIPWLIFLSRYRVLRTPYVGLTIFLVGSIVVGIVAARLVEIPAIRLRDRLFPADASSHAAAPATIQMQPALRRASL